MNTNKLSEYKLSENSVLSESDKKHIENYKQLISFFENAIDSSLSEGKSNYNALHRSCIQCIRYLDSLTYTYEASLQSVKAVNTIIEKIIDDDKKEKDLGNE